MDTRDKIVGEERAAEIARAARAEGRKVALAAGYFDPLLAGHAIRLAAIRAEAGEGVLIAAVCEPARPILPIRARAELAAALSVVNYVVILRGAVEDLRMRLRPDFVFREESADQRRSQQLIARVTQTARRDACGVERPRH